METTSGKKVIQQIRNVIEVGLVTATEMLEQSRTREMRRYWTAKIETYRSMLETLEWIREGVKE